MLSAIVSWMLYGYHGGSWDRAGLVSTTASMGSSHLTTLGITEAASVYGLSSNQTHLFGGQTVDATSILIKFTWGGDANLDGKLNIDDYVRADQGVAAQLTGWSWGDFNYDGKINIDDYTTYIDSNIGSQNGIVY